jgi:hypothetical protein
MRKSLLAQIAPYLLLFYAVGFAAAVLYAWATFSVSQYLPGLRVEFALKRGLVLLIDYLVPLHAAAVAVAASLAGREPAGRASQVRSFSSIVSSTIVAFLLLTAAYTALYEGLSPLLRTRLSDMSYQSALARTYKKQMESDVAAGDFRAALDAVDRYLVVDPSNKERRTRR